MYGQVGAGASTAGGSVGSGSGSAGSAPSGGTPQAPASQAIAGIGMGMQLGNIMADIDLKKSQADLNEAEADKKKERSYINHFRRHKDDWRTILHSGKCLPYRCRDR